MKETTVSVCGVYLFGSAARGDVDSASDTDVLIVYEGSTQEPVKVHAKTCVAATLAVPCTFAEYSRQRLAEMFAQGHLFAWHLYQEARMLHVPELFVTNPFAFTRPQPYASAFRDADNFAGLLKSSVDHLSAGAASLVYEAGIAYVSLRNVGMSLSSVLLGQPVFTRWVPFALASAMRSPPPCSKDIYERFVAARHASQRGRHAPTFDRKILLRQLEYAFIWATSSIEVARGRVTV